MSCASKFLNPRPAVILGVNRERLRENVTIAALERALLDDLRGKWSRDAKVDRIMRIQPPVSQSVLCLLPGQAASKTL